MSDLDSKRPRCWMRTRSSSICCSWTGATQFNESCKSETVYFTLWGWSVVSETRYRRRPTAEVWKVNQFITVAIQMGYGLCRLKRPSTNECTHTGRSAGAISYRTPLINDSPIYYKIVTLWFSIFIIFSFFLVIHVKTWAEQDQIRYNYKVF